MKITVAFEHNLFLPLHGPLYKSKSILVVADGIWLALFSLMITEIYANIRVLNILERWYFYYISDFTITVIDMIQFLISSNLPKFLTTIHLFRNYVDKVLFSLIYLK